MIDTLAKKRWNMRKAKVQHDNACSTKNLQHTEYSNKTERIISTIYFGT